LPDRPERNFPAFISSIDRLTFAPALAPYFRPDFFRVELFFRGAAFFRVVFGRDAAFLRAPVFRVDFLRVAMPSNSPDQPTLRVTLDAFSKSNWVQEGMMLDLQTIEPLACLIGGTGLGVGAESAVRRWPSGLGVFRWVAFALLVSIGIYGALLFWAADFRIGMAPIHRSFVGVVIVLATVVGARLAGRAISLYGHRATGSIISVSLFESVIETLVLVVGLLVVLDYLGISISPILTAFGVGGLAVALALQDTLANLFAGVEIAASQQLHAGDYIRLDSGDNGTVIDINWRNTVVEDVDGNRIIVPNAKLAAAIFMRYRLPMHVDIPITVEKGHATKAAEIARDAAKSVQGSVDTSTRGDVPIRFAKASDTMLDMIVTLGARNPADQRRIHSDFTRAFIERSSADGAGTATVKEVGQ
jgi:small-conductance mechanosensitive channel